MGKLQASAEKNKYMQLLLCFGIVFVVLGHKGGINLFTEWFPYYSFHMPLFIFISGYFYKREYDFMSIAYVKKKFWHLLAPYYKWNLFYGVLASLLKYYGIVKAVSYLSLYNYFVMPFVHGHQFGLNVAMWFVPQLFLVQLIYVFIRRYSLKFAGKKFDYILLIALLGLGVAGVYCVTHGYINGKNDVLYFSHFKRALFRTMFFIPFFHIGFMFKSYWEKWDTLNSAWYFLTIFVLKFLIIYKYGNVSFNAIVDAYPKKVLLPYIVSILGIMFWLRISKVLAPVMSRFKIIRYIGDNTWTVMTHHQLVFFLINVVMLLTMSHIKAFSGFSVAKFQTNMWYAYSMGRWQSLLFYSIVGLSVPLLLQYWYEQHLKDFVMAFREKVSAVRFLK